MSNLNKNLLDEIFNKTIVFYPGPEHLFLSYGIFYINKLYAHNSIILVHENYSQDAIEHIKELFDKIVIIQLKEKGGLKKAQGDQEDCKGLNTYFSPRLFIFTER